MGGGREGKRGKRGGGRGRNIVWLVYGFYSFFYCFLCSGMRWIQVRKLVQSDHKMRVKYIVKLG